MPVAYATELAGKLGLARITTSFQPIVSLKTARIIGYEALVRGRTGEEGQVPAGTLFGTAEERGCLVELDRAAREIALEEFAASTARSSGDAGHNTERVMPGDPGTVSAENRADPSESENLEADAPVLFINFSSWLIDDERIEPGRIMAACAESGLHPGRVAIELVESTVSDLQGLRDFAERNRGAGFLITLDDFGTRHSNLERVALVRPDIIKIDRSIVHGVAGDAYRRSVLRSVVYLARTVGALALAEGVERYEDLLVVAAEEVSLAQGFLFARPAGSFETARIEADEATKRFLPRLTRELAQVLVGSSARRKSFTEQLDDYCRRFETAEDERAEQLLRQLVESISGVECAFLCSSDGTQLSDSVMDGAAPPRAAHALFRPAARGDSHALKDYVYGIASIDGDRYVTDPYVSFASGRLCRTYSRRIIDNAGRVRLLCVDVTEEP
jgi:EAL domain-containing protein (putative c-di-GMP-specific phosphodiesterase class I)